GSDGGSSFFPGAIANAQTYQRALSPAEVITLYTAGRTSGSYADTTPPGQVTTATYDGLNQLTTQTDPPVTNRVTGAVHTAQTTTVYNVDGDPTSITTTDLTGGDTAR